MLPATVLLTALQRRREGPLAAEADAAEPPHAGVDADAFGAGGRPPLRLFISALARSTFSGYFCSKVRIKSVEPHTASRAPTSIDRAATRPPNAHALRPRCNSVYPIGTNWDQLNHRPPMWSREVCRSPACSRST